MVAGPFVCGPLKRWIKQTPALWNAFSKARAAPRLVERQGKWTRRRLRVPAWPPDKQVQSEPALCDQVQQNDSITKAANLAVAMPMPPNGPVSGTQPRRLTANAAG